MKPYYEEAGIAIYHGDCRETTDLAVDVLVTDPPYGVGWRTPPGPTRGGHGYTPIAGDDTPFDPSWLVQLGLPAIIWGANHFGSRLPDSPSWLVWDKRPGGWTNDQADCEMAWSNLGGPARMFRREWGGGGTLARENGAKTRSMHPNQKPIALMRWCIEKCPPGTVLDPYMGSGTTIRAAKDLGRKAIGIEIEERYCEIAAKRLAQGVLDLA